MEITINKQDIKKLIKIMKSTKIYGKKKSPDIVDVFGVNGKCYALLMSSNGHRIIVLLENTVVEHGFNIGISAKNILMLSGKYDVTLPKCYDSDFDFGLVCGKDAVIKYKTDARTFLENYVLCSKFITTDVNRNVLLNVVVRTIKDKTFIASTDGRFICQREIHNDDISKNHETETMSANDIQIDGRFSRTLQLLFKNSKYITMKRLNFKDCTACTAFIEDENGNMFVNQQDFYFPEYYRAIMAEPKLVLYFNRQELVDFLESRVDQVKIANKENMAIKLGRFGDELKFGICRFLEEFVPFDNHGSWYYPDKELMLIDSKLMQKIEESGWDYDFTVAFNILKMIEILKSYSEEFLWIRFDAREIIYGHGNRTRIEFGTSLFDDNKNYRLLMPLRS